MVEKPVMIVGMDDSDESTYALEWTLGHFFGPEFGSDPPFKLVIVHAKSSATSTFGLAVAGAAEVMPYVEDDLRRIAVRVIHNAKQICVAKSVKLFVAEVVEGDARNVLCESVEKHHAIKRAVLGSVSDYCAHHAHCSVMIAKKPKVKH